MATNFNHLLSKPADDVKRPPLLPAGTYHGRVSSHKFDESANKKTPYCRYQIDIQSAGADIEPSMMDGIDLSKRQLRKDFYLTDDALWRLKDFLVSCGIPSHGRSMAEMVPDAINQPVILSVTQRKVENSDEFFNEIGDLKGAS